MRIAYFAYTNLNNHGAPRIHVRAIAEGLADRGHEITLIVPAGFGGIEHKNIRTVEIAQRNLISLLWARKASNWLSQNRGNFDAVYLREFYYSTSIVKASNDIKLPIILEINGSLKSEKNVSAEKLKYRLIGDFDWNFFLRRRLKRADKIIAVTPGLVDEYSSLIDDREKFTFLPNGVDINLFAPAMEKHKLREELDLSRFNPLLGAVGSILPYHIESPILTAIEILEKKYPDLGFVFVGGGPGKEALMNKVQNSSFKDKIIFRGPVPIEDSVKYISSLDLALAWSAKSSAIGGWPVRLSAYSACGIPIVGPDWGTYRIFEKAGVLNCAKRGTAENLAKKAKDILENPDIAEEMGLKGRKYAVENLSWESIVNRTEEILFELVNN